MCVCVCVCVCVFGGGGGVKFANKTCGLVYLSVYRSLNVCSPGVVESGVAG